MPRRTVSDMGSQTTIWLLVLLALVTIARGFPAPAEDDESSGPLPFLQFTKGGIRVNFGGYHAQAGLGGLLTGSSKDGGLHASAGTPSGMHASAGLGGSLDGGPVGGLHARAGLGNGGPEAEAGLGGSLAGAKPEGELFASSSAGNFAVLDRVNKIESDKSKHIQVITRNKKATEQEGEPVAVAASASTNAKVPKYYYREPSSSASSGATANAAATASDGGEKSQQHHARWYFEKRLRERVGPAATSTTTTTTTATKSQNAIAAAEAAVAAAAAGGQEEGTSTTARTRRPAKKQRPIGIFARATAEVDDDGETIKRKTTLFDDIFNIPISALNAVNQLLRNHVGKK